MIIEGQELILSQAQVLSNNGRLSMKVVNRIFLHLQEHIRNPRRNILKSRKVTSEENVYAINLNIKYRLKIRVQKDRVKCLGIYHHDSAYSEGSHS